MISQPSVSSLLIASIDGVEVGFPASSVESILRAVEVSAVPGAPGIIEGAVNVRGQVLPVIGLRARLGFPARAVDPSDVMIVLSLGDRRVLVRVDAVDDIAEIEAGAMREPASLSPALRGLEGVAARASGALVIYDPAAFLSQAEREAVDVALAPLVMRT